MAAKSKEQDSGNGILVFNLQGTQEKRLSRLLWVICSATLIGSATLQAQNPFGTEVKAGYQSISNNILKAAEKMPDEDYSFRATPDVRNLGQLVAHVANAQMGMCSIAKGGEMKHGDGVEDQ